MNVSKGRKIGLIAVAFLVWLTMVQCALLPIREPVPTATIAPKTAKDRPTPTPTPIPFLVRSELQRVASDAPEEEVSRLVEDNAAFAFSFYQAVRSRHTNLFYSPYSLSLGLSMAYAGARSETEAQMAQTLRFSLAQEQLHPAINALDLQLAQRGRIPPDEDPPEAGKRPLHFQLELARAIFGEASFSFSPDYLDLLAENYGAGMRLADFMGQPEASREQINQWISQQTRGKVEELVPPGTISENTRLVIANTITFNSSWHYPFNSQKTYAAPFTLLDGTQIHAPRMVMDSSLYLPYVREANYQAVQLAYAPGEVTMLLIVPDEGAFIDFESTLDATFFNGILKMLKHQNVRLEMPRFTFESSFSLKEILAEMGMPLAFSNQADFSAMDGEGELFLSDMFHHARVALDEEGTEAAAAALFYIEVEGVTEEVLLNVDRPFIFVIRDNPTGAILFVGRVLNPVP